MTPWTNSPLNSSVQGISQARILEWVDTLLFPTDLPNPGIKTTSPALAGGFFITEPPENPQRLGNIRPIHPQGEGLHVDNHHMPQGKNIGQLSSKF